MMLVRIIFALLLIASSCYAADFRQVVGYSVGGDDSGGCETQSLLIDQSGPTYTNIADIDDSGDVKGASIPGNGKRIHSIVLKTGTGSQGVTTTYTAYINTSTDMSGTVVDSFSITTPGTIDTEFTGYSQNRPVLSDGVTHYIAVHKSDATWATRLGLAGIYNASHNYWYSTTGLSTLTQSEYSTLWIKVYTCD